MSIIIALVFLLICTVIGAVIISSASANVERSKQDIVDQQSYFALSSAIESADIPFSGAGFSMSAASASDELTQSGTVTSAGDSVLQWTEQSSKSVFDNKTGVVPSTAREFQVHMTNDTDGTYDVTLTYTMSKAYAITVTASMTNQTDYQGTLTKVITPVFSGSTVGADGSLTYQYPFTVTWQS